MGLRIMEKIFYRFEPLKILTLSYITIEKCILWLLFKKLYFNKCAPCYLYQSQSILINILI